MDKFFNSYIKDGRGILTYKEYLSYIERCPKLNITPDDLRIVSASYMLKNWGGKYYIPGFVTGFTNKYPVLTYKKLLEAIIREMKNDVFFKIVKEFDNTEYIYNGDLYKITFYRAKNSDFGWDMFEEYEKIYEFYAWEGFVEGMIIEVSLKMLKEENTTKK